MEVFKKPLFDFARKVAKEKDPNKEGGFWVFCTDLIIEAMIIFIMQWVQFVFIML